MSLKGFIKISLLSLQTQKYKNQPILVKAKALDAQIQTKITNEDPKEQKYFLLPVADKVSLEVHGNIHSIGYFQLPLKKIYQFPTKKHVISINCVTKDPVSGQISADVYCILKLAIMFFQDKIANFDIYIDKLQLYQQKMDQLQRCLYIQTLIGNVSSHTTVKKRQNGAFLFKESLPFKLQSIPGTMQFIIKDKDMVNDEVIGKLSRNPQKQQFFDQKNPKKQKEYTFQSQKKKLKLYLSTKFRIPESQ